MSRITGIEANCQHRFWAKMTKFKSGHFEMSVISPRHVPTPEVKVYVPKGCAVSFDSITVNPSDFPRPQVTIRARKVLPDEERAKQDAENLARTVRRARQKVRHLIKAFGADHMLTFTYRHNMESVEQLKADWKRFLRLMRGRYPDWQFVCIREKQERGAYHLHVAVKGKQDIRWILRCWYLAIGMEWEVVQAWYVHHQPIGEKTLGAVNVRAPQKRWGGNGSSWRPEKLAGYLTKYLGKEFQEASEHYSMRYWHSKGIEKPQVVRFWMGAQNISEAIYEAHDMVYYKGAENLSLWKPDDWNNLYISGDGLKWDFETE